MAINAKRVPLLSGAYQARSYIASAQRCINLYAENNADPQAPVPVTHYPTPGTELYAQAAVTGKVRCTYRSSIGTCYVVVGPNVYFLATNRAMVLLGSIADRPSQVIMSDNGLAVVLVDGTEGWAIEMSSNTLGQIIDASFYGAAFVTFLDTFFVFNRPATNQFYISLSMVDYTMLTGGTAFDPLDIAAKAGSADPIVAILAVHRELWLIGELTTEVWAGSGSADFYFQLQQGAFIDHGCIAAYSATNQDLFSFWLMQDKQGKAVVVQAGGYQVTEISTPAIVADFQSYADISDAIGGCFQKDDHSYYVLAFPSANKTWAYDLKTGQWFEWNWMDENGNLNRHRFNCCMFAQGYNLIGDWEVGTIWALKSDIFTDGNPTNAETRMPIPRIRTFPHIIINGVRVNYQQFVADMAVGSLDSGGDEDEDLDPLDNPNIPKVSLRWSDDRGKSYGNAVIQPAGTFGEYLTQINWNRLGMARDRVFELSWSSPFETALNGAFIQYTPAGS